MPTERFNSLVSSASQSVHDYGMQTVEWIAGTKPAKKIMRGVSRYVIEQGLDLFSYEGLDEAFEKVRPHLENKYKLVVLSSHKSHGEISPGIRIMGQFMDEFPGILNEFVFPVAASMAGGEQGNIIKTFYEDGLVPNLADKNIKALPVVTDNDVKRRGYKQNKMGNGLKVVRNLRKDGTGFFIFIEGTVDGGRKNPETGDINGLGYPDSMLYQLLEYSRDSNTPMVFVTLGMSNSHNLLSADGKFFTPLWVKGMTENAVGLDNTYADVVCGSVISSDNLNLANIPQAADNLMYSIASALPEHERGKYKIYNSF